MSLMDVSLTAHAVLVVHDLVFISFFITSRHFENSASHVPHPTAALLTRLQTTVSVFPL